jgi:hypothetical protein
MIFVVIWAVLFLAIFAWIAYSFHVYVRRIPQVIVNTADGSNIPKVSGNQNGQVSDLSLEPDFVEINRRLDERKVRERPDERVTAHVSGLGDEEETEAPDMVQDVAKLRGIIR